MSKIRVTMETQLTEVTNGGKVEKQEEVLQNVHTVVPVTMVTRTCGLHIIETYEQETGNKAS